MEFEKLRIIKIEEKNKIIFFEKELEKESSDPMAFMTAWSAPWREESLDHYLNIGWSMGHFTEDMLTGYVLVQPLLFFRGQTQSLWIEAVRGFDEMVKQTLFEAIIRVAKEKHLQQVCFHQSLYSDFEKPPETFIMNKDKNFNFIKTTKWEG